MARKDNDYFSMFIDVAESFCDAAAYLEQNLKAFDPDTLNTTLEQMHILAHTPRSLLRRWSARILSR